LRFGANNELTNERMIVLDYALDDGEVQLARYKPEGIEELSRTTKFTRKELQIIYRGFKQVATSTYSLHRPYTKIYIFSEILLTDKLNTGYIPYM